MAVELASAVAVHGPTTGIVLELLATTVVVPEAALASAVESWPPTMLTIAAGRLVWAAMVILISRIVKFDGGLKFVGDEEKSLKISIVKLKTPS